MSGNSWQSCYCGSFGGVNVRRNNKCFSFLAAVIQPRGYILDTLATSYWANGLVEEAVASERQAIFADPPQRKYYQMQIERFSRQSYDESLPPPRAANEGGKN